MNVYFVSSAIQFQDQSESLPKQIPEQMVWCMIGTA